MLTSMESFIDRSSHLWILRHKPEAEEKTPFCLKLKELDLYFSKKELCHQPVGLLILIDLPQRYFSNYYFDCGWLKVA